MTERPARELGLAKAIQGNSVEQSRRVGMKNEELLQAVYRIIAWLGEAMPEAPAAFEHGRCGGIKPGPEPGESLELLELRVGQLQTESHPCKIGRLCLAYLAGNRLSYIDGGQEVLLEQGR